MFQLAEKHAVLIAGPTASGKSSLALVLAREAERQGRAPVIINADSMQVYRELSIISARPTDDDISIFPHKLYGFVMAARRYNTGQWLRDIKQELARVQDGALPIIVGGTGLYFKALLSGFATMPEIPDEVRKSLKHYLAEKGRAALYKRLVECDPEMAKTLDVGDSQRVLRALEVYIVSGRSLLDYHASAQQQPLLKSDDCLKLVAWPERAALYQKIEQRFDHMVQAGAVEEVAALYQQRLDPSLPAMKAIGVPQIICYLESQLSLDEAIAQAKQESRRYAKRQMTFMRNQMDDQWQRRDTFA